MTPVFKTVRMLLQAAATALAGLASNSIAATAVPLEFVSACESRLPPAVVEVKTEVNPVTYVYDRSVRDLTLQHPPGGNEKTLGLTDRAFRSRMEVNGQTLAVAGTDLVCLRPVVTMTLSLEPHVVAIGKEFSPETCAFDAIARHEQQHVVVNNLALERTAALMTRALQDAFAERVFYGPRAQLQANLQAYLQEWLDWAEVELKKVDQLHRQIDTPEEYARNEHICGGEIPRVLRANGY